MLEIFLTSPPLLFFIYFKGSYPPFEKGLHFTILFIPKILPFIAPYLSIACNVYSEQVGLYLHLTPKYEDMYF